MKFAVIGGDTRISRLYSLLVEDGHEVSAFALEEAGEIACEESVRAAAAGSGCVILPLPLSVGQGLLNAPQSKTEHRLEDVLSGIPQGSTVCAGRVRAEEYALAGKYGLTLCDYLSREELAVSNAAATAEGAIELMMQDTDFTLWNSRIAVIGFGRIGKILAHRLHGLGARVSVSARKCGDMEWIRVYGYSALDTRSLAGSLGEFDIIVNTVPAPVIGEAELRDMKKGVLCIDLASKPGGVDFEMASALGIRAVWALSLPGEVAPASSGRIIKETIYNILEEKTCGKT